MVASGRYEQITAPPAATCEVWTPVDDFVMSPSNVNLASGNSLAASALLVQFGATQRADTIFLGTGEPAFGAVQ